VPGSWQLEWDQTALKFLSDRFSADPAAAQHTIYMCLQLAFDPYTPASAESAVIGIRTLVDGGTYVVYEPLESSRTVRILGVGRTA